MSASEPVDIAELTAIVHGKIERAKDDDDLGNAAGLPPADRGRVWRMVRDALAYLLADRDHWEAEAKRYRPLCPVTAENVESAGVTSESAWRWRHEHNARAWPVDSPQQRAIAVNQWASESGRPAFDILDEMAAQEAP